jgi:hypothetical protein
VPERRIDLVAGVPQDIPEGPDRSPRHPRRQFISLRTQLCRRLAQALKAQRSTASRVRLSASNATRSMPST